MTYYIWSYRHRQWWGPDRGGYTLRLERAGTYSEDDAGDIMLSGLPGANIAVDRTLAVKLEGCPADSIEEELDVWRRL